MRAYILHKHIGGFGAPEQIKTIDVSDYTIEALEAWLKDNSPFPAPRDEFIQFKYEHYDDR